MYGFLEKMLDALTSAYNKATSSNIGKLFSILSTGYEEIQAANQRILAYRDIDQATGYTLDKWGKNVGVSRGGLPDNIYRIYIKTKLSSLISGGDINTIINSAATIFGISPYDVSVVEECPAKVTVSIPESAVLVLGDEYDTRVEVAREYLKKIIAAGINLNLVIVANPETSASAYVGAVIVDETTVTTEKSEIEPAPTSFDEINGGDMTTENGNVLYGGTYQIWDNGGNEVNGNTEQT